MERCGGKLKVVDSFRLCKTKTRKVNMNLCSNTNNLKIVVDSILVQVFSIIKHEAKPENLEHLEFRSGESGNFSAQWWWTIIWVHQKVAFLCCPMVCLQKSSNRIHSQYPNISIFRALFCWGWSNHIVFCIPRCNNVHFTPCVDLVNRPDFAQSRIFATKNDKKTETSKGSSKHGLALKIKTHLEVWTIHFSSLFHICVSPKMPQKRGPEFPMALIQEELWKTSAANEGHSQTSWDCICKHHSSGNHGNT